MVICIPVDLASRSFGLAAGIAHAVAVTEAVN